MKKQKPSSQFRSLPQNTRQTIMLIDSQLENEQYRMLAYLLYFTGCRVSEALLLKQENFETFVDERSNQKFLLIKQIRVLKQRKRDVFRDVEFPINEYTQKLYDFVQNNPTKYLWRVARKQAWRHVHKIKWMGQNLYPHFFRHLINSHLKYEYGFEDEERRDFFKWKSLQMVLEYLISERSNLRLKLLKHNQEKVSTPEMDIKNIDTVELVQEGLITEKEVKEIDLKKVNTFS